jgi:glycosyltransferase involved in cell wall biosynthesis
MMKLAIIIFAFNEEKSIGAVIDRLPTTITGIDHIDIIVVDDGSTDRTRAIALARGAQVVSHPTNKGLGAAFATGIDAGLLGEADIIVSLDGDGQHPPEEIPRLLAPLLQGRAEFVTASRFGDPALVPEMPALKRFGNWLMARITGLACGRTFTDAACGFRAYSRDAALHMTIFGGHTYTQETLVDLARRGTAIAEVPVAIRGVREHGTSRVADSVLRYGLKTFTILARAVRDRLPLAFFGAIGATLAAVGAGAEMMVLVRFLAAGKTSPYQSLTVLGAIFLILGAFSFLIAILADMLGRMRETQETLLYLQRRRHYAELAGQNTPRNGERQVAVPSHLAAERREAPLAATSRTE